MAETDGDTRGGPGVGGVGIDVGFGSVVRVRGITRARLTLKAVAPELTIDKLEGALPLSGEADNLAREIDARLVWLVQREGSGVEEIPHAAPVVVVPSKTDGVLKAIPFDLKELRPPKGGDATAKPERKSLAWDVLRLGLLGTAKIGFRLETSLPTAKAVSLAPGDAGVSLAIPLEVQLLDGAGAPLGAGGAGGGGGGASALRVGSDVSFRVTSGSLFDGLHARLRVWESEADRALGSEGTVGVDHTWQLSSSEPHVETLRLGAGAGALWYTIDLSGAPQPLRFRYELGLLDADGKEIPGARPARHALIVEAPAPVLEAWAIELLPAASAGSAGPPLFRARGKIANLSPDFGPAVSAALMRYEPHLNRQGLPLPVLTALAKKDVCVSAQASSPGGGAGGGGGDGGTAAQGPEPGEIICDFVLSDDDLKSLPKDPPAQLFAVLSFPADSKSAGQPFAELVRYEANMSNDGKDTGFAPYKDGALALPTSGTGVCTDLIDLQGHVTDLESSATADKAPPPWVGDPFGPLTVEDELNDLRPWEGVVAFMYRDNAPEGNITVGIGNLIDSLASAQKLPFMNMNEGRAATADEIATAWNKVSAMPRALSWVKYQLDPNIGLAYEEIVKLFQRRFDDFMKTARQKFPDFDTYPKSARRGIIDMLYGLGSGGFDTFKRFGAAVRKRDWKTAAAESLQSGDQARADWLRSLFEYAQTVDSTRTTASAPPAGGAASPAAGGH